MKVVHLPLIVLIVLIISLLSTCRHRPPFGTPQADTLKIIINGPIALVRKKSDPSRVILIAPRDPQNVHEFYFNDIEYYLSKDQDYHIRLAAEGLGTSVRPRIDPYLSDFVAETDLWKMEKYFVMVELPAPDEITFVPPLEPVVFENGKTGYMSTNYVLSYHITDLEKVRLISPELKEARPLSTDVLQKQYEGFCSKTSSRYHDSCIEIRNLLAQCTGPRTRIFFFGIGMPVGHENVMTQSEEEDHALHFFNDVLLRSFPHLKNLRLAKIGFRGGDLRGNMSPTALKVSFQENDFFGDPERNWHGMYPKPVSAVIDCKAGNLMVGVTD